jgi:hypothetical protein
MTLNWRDKHTHGVVQWDCPPGTYSPSNLLASSDECWPCVAGSFCVGGQVRTSVDSVLSERVCMRSVYEHQYVCVGTSLYEHKCM